MKIPSRILDLARGPILVTAAMACSSSSSGPAPDPVPPPVEEVAESGPIDPVDYDAAREAERLGRTDVLLVADDQRRERRIEDEEEARQSRRLEALLSAREMHLMRRCGRG